jgi:hypothetical protein
VDFGDLHVPLVGGDPSEVINMPTPLLWLAQVVAMNLHVEHRLEVAYWHFFILLASLMEEIASQEPSKDD